MDTKAPMLCVLLPDAVVVTAALRAFVLGLLPNCDGRRCAASDVAERLPDGSPMLSLVRAMIRSRGDFYFVEDWGAQ